MIKLHSFIILAVICSCQQQIETPVVVSGYQQYLIQKKTQKANNPDNEIQFWNDKFHKHPAYLYLLKSAGLLAGQFKRDGNITHLVKSDSLLNYANTITQKRKAGIYQMLASNAITQHKFLNAQQYLKKAWDLGESKQTTLLMTFDVEMELGQYNTAKELLNRLVNKSTFDYLIRLSKLKDHQGELGQAIALMEQAFNRIKNTNNDQLYCWALSNLGDMYSHHGRVRKAYQAYLKVLLKDPGYAYALKGIAWIAYSQDRNHIIALEILNFVKANSQLPDLLLVEAEMLEFKGDKTTSRQLMDEFYSRATDPIYGDMFNKYVALLSSEIYQNHSQAKVIAQMEVLERPTPQSYDLLAWSHFNSGDILKAKRIADSKLAQQTFEPEILYHLGAIYKANGQRRKGHQYLKMALESSYELGPITSSKIERLIEN